MGNKLETELVQQIPELSVYSLMKYNYMYIYVYFLCFCFCFLIKITRNPNTGLSIMYIIRCLLIVAKTKKVKMWAHLPPSQ